MPSKITLYVDAVLEQLNLLSSQYFNIVDISEAKYPLKDNELIVLTDTTSSIMDTYPITKGVDLRREHDIKILTDLDTAGIPTPVFHYVHDPLAYVNVMDAGKQYMLKYILQVRSIGKHVVTDELLMEMRYATSALDVPEFNEKYSIDPGHFRTTDETELIYNGLRSSGRLYITELFPFTEEYRVLYTKDTPVDEYLIFHRSGYFPGSEESRTATFIPLQDSTLTLDMLERVRKFADSTNKPALSFDIAVNSNTKEWTVFEYSTEFGIANIKKEAFGRFKKQYTRAFLAVAKLLLNKE